MLVVRDVAKGERALAAAGVDPSVYDLRALDLADLASVRAFADGSSPTSTASTSSWPMPE